jgi:hypothetical protein
MANELTIQDMTNMAVSFTKSGFFGYKTSAEAFTLMCLAQANGLHPAKAAERYHIIQGRPAMKADAMLAAFQESGGKVRWVKRTDKECTLHLEHPQGGELDVTWTMARAQAAGLTGKQTWKQYPTQMLSARCVSEGVRALYPACLCGMYTPEEVIDFTPSDKKAQAEFAPSLDVTAEAQETAPEAPATIDVTEVPAATETPAERAESAPAEIVDDDTHQFLTAMKNLAKKNRKAYVDAMGNLGYESASEVPANRRQPIYDAVSNAVNGAIKEG